MGGQFSYKIVLKSFGTKPQVENDHAGENKTTNKSIRAKAVKFNAFICIISQPYLITRTTNVRAVRNLSRRSSIWKEA